MIVPDERDMIVAAVADILERDISLARHRPGLAGAGQP